MIKQLGSYFILLHRVDELFENLCSRETRTHKGVCDKDRHTDNQENDGDL